ncbi:hypothetical protein KEM60_00859 [Austwickia sp. TVS 96-490-7B]|uniref:RDD family protein n=1 Tax=Austwickia sp. TVS 96-490-7B TaxID=2830843 RepID=UPI001C58F657|nr:RDD family protein [Austwickia sp. TVS 96-490-7B]MBW3084670.1 hypothetical protein [Austwickia sp. TVS 96-490-7B]
MNIAGPSESYPGAAQPSENLVTGEAVALDLPSASLGIRALSGVMDLFFTWSIVIVPANAASLFVAGIVDPAVAATVSVVVIVAGMITFPVVCETFSGGRSLAKLVLGLRTIRDDGGPISFRHALTRQLVGVMEIYMFTGAPALVTGLLNTRSKRLGDLAAGTYVVQDRYTPPHPKQGSIAPPLVAWAQHADIAPLPDQLALSIRELLSRAPQIRPVPRQQLAMSLAAQAVAHVSPGPPPGTPPEMFLEAVLVERGRRDWVRLQQQQEFRRRITARHETPCGPSWG